jgi:quinol monooxygenase YgiN
LLSATRAAPGCLAARLLVDIDDTQKIVLIEEWESHEQYEMQLDTEKLSALVAVIELSNGAPIVHIDLVMRKEGIDNLPFDRFIVRRAAM